MQAYIYIRSERATRAHSLYNNKYTVNLRWGTFQVYNNMPLSQGTKQVNLPNVPVVRRSLPTMPTYLAMPTCLRFHCIFQVSSMTS